MGTKAKKHESKKTRKHKNKKTRVLVAMSGGIDSSVAAFLLLEQGYEVIGVTIKNFCYRETKANTQSCCSMEGIRDAKLVCGALGAKHYVVNAEKKFASHVISDFISEYQKGNTPNPCMRCNQQVRFPLLFDLAKELCAEKIATGHYTAIKKHGKNLSLCRGKDREKDQSYFLYRFSQQQLSKILFPLGKYTKPEVKKIGIQQNFFLPEKKESQDVCFITTSLGEFLNRHLALLPGPIIDENKKKIGTHRGLALFTIGQKTPVGGTGPYYAYQKNKKRNALLVVRNPKSPLLFPSSAFIEKTFWTHPDELKFPLLAFAQIRYRQKAAPVKVLQKKKNGKNSYVVEFLRKQRALAKGQTIVFYARDNKTVVGGGIIRTCACRKNKSSNYKI